MNEGIQVPFTIVFSFKERGKTLEGYTKYDLIIRQRTSEFSSTLRNLPVLLPDYLEEESSDTLYLVEFFSLLNTI